MQVLRRVCPETVRQVPVLTLPALRGEWHDFRALIGTRSYSNGPILLHTQHWDD